jgi:hypothetical protein
LILSEPQSTLVRGHSQVNAWWISLVQINVWHMSIPMEKSNLELIWNNTYYMQLLPMSTVKYNTVKSCYLKVHRTFQKFWVIHVHHVWNFFYYFVRTIYIF